MASVLEVRGVFKKKTRFLCELLGIKATVTVVQSKLDGFGGEMHAHKDGTFTILVHDDWGDDVVCVIAHELVHIKQRLDGRLSYKKNNKYKWLGKKYQLSDELDDEYYLAPWEMEARAFEAFCQHKWLNRKKET